MYVHSGRAVSGGIETRSIRSWEYLSGGLLLLFAGIMSFAGLALSGAGSGTTAGVPSFLVMGPVGALILGAGGYWPWKFDRVHQTELSPQSNRPTTR